MDGDNSHDDTVVLIDLLITLEPKLQSQDWVHIEKIRSWLGADDDAREALDDIHEADDIPVVYYSEDRERVTSPNPGGISDAIEDLEEDPPWYARD